MEPMEPTEPLVGILISNKSNRNLHIVIKVDEEQQNWLGLDKPEVCIRSSNELWSKAQDKDSAFHRNFVLKL